MGLSDGLTGLQVRNEKFLGLVREDVSRLLLILWVDQEGAGSHSSHVAVHSAHIHVDSVCLQAFLARLDLELGYVEITSRLNQHGQRKVQELRVDTRVLCLELGDFRVFVQEGLNALLNLRVLHLLFVLDDVLHLVDDLGEGPLGERARETHVLLLWLRLGHVVPISKVL